MIVKKKGFADSSLNFESENLCINPIDIEREGGKMEKKFLSRLKYSNFVGKNVLKGSISN